MLDKLQGIHDRGCDDILGIVWHMYQQLVWSIVLGNFVSSYLALLNGLDPSPLALVRKLKQALDA